jgi:uncharacterized protein (TIGR02217 family)
MAFIETRLLECVAYGSAGGPTFKTRKIPLRSGIMRRNPLRSRPLYAYNLLYRNLRPESYEDVIAAFNACYAGVHSFRWKDPADYIADNELLAELGTGVPQQIQLAKIYEFGTEAISRPIRKPVVGTVTMTQDGSPLTASIDYTTGIASFTAGAGNILRWSGEFDVPVMFRDDELPFSADSRGADGLFLTADIGLEEDISV